MSAATFIREFARNWNATGAVLPSSPAMAACIVDAAGVATARHVLELGPGTGPFTAVVRAAMPAHARYLGIEVNPVFVAHLRERFPGLTFAESPAQAFDFDAWLPPGAGFEAVVCGLPWTAFPEPMQAAILGNVLPRLAPGGRFATFAYFGLHWLPRGRAFRALLRRQPGTLRTTPVVWRNVPPAFVYVLERPADGDAEG